MWPAPYLTPYSRTGTVDSPVFVEHASLQGPVVCFLVRMCCGLGTPSSSNCVDCNLGCGVFALFV